MRIDTSASASELRKLFPKFISITGWKLWKSRLAAFEQQVAKNPLLKEYHDERYPLELEVGRIHKAIRLGKKIKLPNNYNSYSLFSFIAAVTRVYGKLNTEGKTRLEGMIRSGLNNEFGLTPLKHEVNIATHLTLNGFDVTFSDLESTDRFDLLAELSGLEIEVECKAHSADVGRKIHKHQLYQLGGRIFPIIKSALSRRSGGQLAQIKLPGRLDRQDQHLKEIAVKLANVLQSGASDHRPEPCAIQYDTLRFTNSPIESTVLTGFNDEIAREYLKKECGIDVGNVLIISQPFHGAVVVTVESEKPDQVIPGIVNQLKKLVKHQFTGSRPGLICVRFSDITEAELLQLAEADKAGYASSLQQATSSLLDREDWRNVHTLAYFAPGHIEHSKEFDHQAIKRKVTETGPAYTFLNPHHELASDNRLKIFKSYAEF